MYALEMTKHLSQPQTDLLSLYAASKIPILVVDGMLNVSDDELVGRLPSIADLKQDQRCQTLASRNQLILNLAGNSAFSYDLDYNEMVRFVGNFCGGGKVRLVDEPEPDEVEISSHSGLALGAHTEPPYYCSFRSEGGHSPAPSTLILTSRWNPLREPTSVIPIKPILDSLDPLDLQMLGERFYRFTRPDSHVAGEDGVGVSIIDFSENGDYAIRFSAYRFSVTEDAPLRAQVALDALNSGIARARTIRVPLDSSSALLINNTKALHCRDQIRDNRRLLVRLYGYNIDVSAIEHNSDPMLVVG